MSLKVRTDSMFKFAESYYDESQDEYVWGIADPPEPQIRDDDQYYTWRDGDRFDIVAHRMLGSSRYFWVILHYNGISDAIGGTVTIGTQLRLPSKTTLEREYTNAFTDAATG